MKTYNKHPQWFNEPLRLTKKQKQNPHLVIVEFFEDFHLNETRQTLWELLVEFLSSPHSISNDSHKRNDCLFFYERIETLIEAAFMLHKKAKKKNKRKWNRNKPKGVVAM